MKKYIFITADIHVIGGMQNYVRSKAKYLVQHNWQVYIFFAGSKENGCLFSELDQYVGGGIRLIRIAPESIFHTIYYKVALSEMLQLVHYDNTKNDEYIIESHADYEAIWGEILAKEISAKHICFICNERFRGSDKLYDRYIDFFKYKYDRNELAGIHETSLKLLFEGYMNVEASQRNVLEAAYDLNVEEIYFERVHSIEKKDWNIAYIGRCEKSYFPYIIKEIISFCSAHANKQIQFIIVGDVAGREEMIQHLEEVTNLTICAVGFFPTIPQELFRKIDVAIAGAGCCEIATRCNVPTIVPDAIANTAMGIYGYTSDSLLYSSTRFTYSELLENVLVTKEYLKYPKKIPHFLSTEEACQNFFDFVSKSETNKEYFDFSFTESVYANENEKDLYNIVIDCLEKIKKYTKLQRLFVERIYKKYGRNLGLYGYGRIGVKILDSIPDLEFTNIIDKNQTIHPNVKIPTTELLNTMSVLIVTPISYRWEIADELNNMGYEGEIVYFHELLDDFLKNL